MTRCLCVYGLSEDALRERLAPRERMPGVTVTVSGDALDATLTLSGEPVALEAAVAELAARLGEHLYSTQGESLTACVVRRLAALSLTVATAESCTGGLIAAALTQIPGASQVFGTGIVSYSSACKQALLAVSPDTLASCGAVSAETAGQMARGVRQTAGAQLGVSVTGEAGPIAAEAVPVGTVYIALADKKRTWVQSFCFEGADRDAVRRRAATSVLWLLWRYVCAYPAVMAGGEAHRRLQQREIPRTEGEAHPRLLSRLLPWRGDSRRQALCKCLIWLAVVAVFATGLYAAYRHLSAPGRNRALQSSLGDLYWNEATDLTQGAASLAAYPEGMLPALYGLYDLNEDVGGWLYIPDTGADYPVMNYTDGVG